MCSEHFCDSLDAELLRQKARDEYVGDTVLRQLQGADLIVLNRIDLVIDEVLQTVVAWLHELVPGVRIVKAKLGRGFPRKPRLLPAHLGPPGRRELEGAGDRGR